MTAYWHIRKLHLISGRRLSTCYRQNVWHSCFVFERVWVQISAGHLVILRWFLLFLSSAMLGTAIVRRNRPSYFSSISFAVHHPQIPVSICIQKRSWIHQSSRNWGCTIPLWHEISAIFLRDGIICNNYDMVLTEKNRILFCWYCGEYDHLLGNGLLNTGWKPE